VITYEWRGAFTNAEVNALHAEAFDHEPDNDDRRAQLERHSLGWVCARDDDFDEQLRPFYFGSCGFRSTDAGLIALQATGQG
jgi:hypothetical protein